MTQEQFLTNEIFQDELVREVQKRAFMKRCNVIHKWMEAEEKVIQENTLDIPDFLKPKEDQFESRFNRGLRTSIKDGNFWDVYDNARTAVGC